MKILQSCLSASWGGLEQFCLETSAKLAERGNEVTLICLTGSPLHEHSDAAGLPVLTVSGKNFLAQVFTLKKIFCNTCPEIIHTHLSADLSVIVPALKMSSHDSKLILTKAMESGVSKKDFWHRWLYKNTDCVIAISRFIRKNILNTAPVNENKVIVIYDAVNTEKFNPVKYSKYESKKKFNINSELLITLIGRITWGKGHEEFISAAKIILEAKEIPSVEFIIAGESNETEKSYEQKLRDIVNNSGLSGKIHFTGFLPDVPALLSATDIFAFPSHTESFGLALAEAMSMGIACAASDFGGILDIIIHEKNGLLFRRRDTSSLTEALLRFIRDKDFREQTGKEARKTILEKFEINKHIDNIEKLYNRICSQ